MSAMFSSVLKEVTGVLDRRFLLTAFFPSLVFWVSLVVAIALGRGNLAALVQAWNDQEGTHKALQIVGFLAGVAFFAMLLSSQLTAILRFYEGYWDFPLGRACSNLGKRWHQQRLALIPDMEYSTIYLEYPLPTQLGAVMPTRLGNILKNAELYARDRYGIDPVLIWSRLYHLYPERFVQAIAASRGDLDFMLSVSSLGAAFALFSGVILLWIGADWLLFLLCFVGGLLVAMLAYRGAVGSALLYADHIKTAFDLYRNDFLKQLRLTLPANPEAERQLWSQVNQYLYANVPPPGWTYSDPVAQEK